MSDITVTTLFFGQLGDLVNPSTAAISVAEGTTAMQLYQQIRALNPSLPSPEEDKSLKVAMNQRFVDWTAQLSAGDEIAFMPPVTGG